MSDLARQAMEKIAEIVGDRFEDADVEVLRAGVNSVGVLVSHEDAALLRQVKNRTPFSEEDERVGFKAWAGNLGLNLTRHENGVYVSETTWGAFKAWLAAKMGGEA